LIELVFGRDEPGKWGHPSTPDVFEKVETVSKPATSSQTNSKNFRNKGIHGTGRTKPGAAGPLSVNREPEPVSIRRAGKRRTKKVTDKMWEFQSAVS